MGLDAQAQADEHTQDRTTHAAFHRPATAAGTFTPAPTLMRTLPHEFLHPWLARQAAGGQKSRTFEGAAPYAAYDFKRVFVCTSHETAFLDLLYEHRDTPR